MKPKLNYQPTIIMKYIIYYLFLLLTVNASAAVKCVGPGGTGLGSGSDYNNLLSWTSAPVRGDVWYIVDGTYSGKDFNTVESGTMPITIKKATVADHGGISAGWSNDMGDGQAIISGSLRFSEDFYIFDGNTDVVGTWGIKVNTTSSPGIAINKSTTSASETGSNNITVKDVWVDLTGSSPGVRGVDATRGPDNLVLTNVRITLSTDDCININAGANNTTIEYCWIDRAGNYGTIHADAIVIACAGGNNNVIRYNVIDWGGQQIWIDGTCSSYSDWEIYGNVFYSTTMAGAKWISHHSNVTNINKLIVRNNTIIECPVGGRMTAAIATQSWANNLYYGSFVPQPGREVTSAFGGSSASGGTSPQTGITPAQFVNFVGKDFRLASPTNAGTTFPAPYNKDRLGSTRGASGVWDRGAYEFVSGGPPTPTPTPTPEPTPTPGPTPSPTPSPPPEFIIGGRIEIDKETNVRSAPVINADNLVGVQPQGALGTLLEGPALSSDGIVWWKVDFDTGVDGWSGDDNFVATTKPPPGPTPTPSPTPVPTPSPTPPIIPPHTHDIPPHTHEHTHPFSGETGEANHE